MVQSAARTPWLPAASLSCMLITRMMGAFRFRNCTVRSSRYMLQDLLSAPPWDLIAARHGKDVRIEFCVGMLRLLRFRKLGVAFSCAPPPAHSLPGLSRTAKKTKVAEQTAEKNSILCTTRTPTIFLSPLRTLPAQRCPCTDSTTKTSCCHLRLPGGPCLPALLSASSLSASKHLVPLCAATPCSCPPGGAAMRRRT